MQQYGLTEKQLKLFKFIKNYITKNKISPSYEEMKVAIGVKSKSNIQRKVEQLEDRGWLTKLNKKSRSIKILK
jgi:repressor LexA|tara:strand:- start:39 stop:257 length:219 start_codon:yes stop_codon:yes gene_type:complete